MSGEVEAQGCAPSSSANVPQAPSGVLTPLRAAQVRERAFMTKSLAQMEESARHQSVHDLKKVLGPALLTVVRTPCFKAALRLVSTVQCCREHKHS